MFPSLRHRSFFLFLLTLPLAECAVLNLPSTDFATNAVNANISNPMIPPHCNGTIAWAAPGTTFNSLYGDCVQASLSFAATADEFGTRPFEFYTAGKESPVHGIVSMVTPRRYIYSESVK